MTEQRDGFADPAPARRRRLGRLARIGLLAAIFALPAAGAVLNFVGVYLDGSSEVPDGLDEASGVALSPEGRHAYATGREDDALVVFVRDATAETLSFVEVLFDQVAGVFGLDGASSVTVSHDGRHVYATGEVDDALAVFARDASADTLAFVEDHVDGVGGVFGLDGASSVTATTDGRHVYVTGAVSGAVAWFARDASLDTLSFIDARVDGVDGVEGLAGARSIAEIPPGGLRLYVAGAVDDSISIFRRDPLIQGRLTYLDSVTDGVDGIDGLEGVSALLLPRMPNAQAGYNLYAAGRDEDALAVFRLSAGFPTQIQLIRNGQNGVTGLTAPTALALSHDGRYVYVGTAQTGLVTVFRREVEDGRLTFIGSTFDTGGQPILGGNALAGSPDGKHLLIASSESDAVVMYRHDALFSDGFESGDVAQWSASVP